jgi:hypothetical protein
MYCAMSFHGPHAWRLKRFVQTENAHDPPLASNDSWLSGCLIGRRRWFFSPRKQIPPASPPGLPAGLHPAPPGAPGPRPPWAATGGHGRVRASLPFFSSTGGPCGSYAAITARFFNGRNSVSRKTASRAIIQPLTSPRFDSLCSVRRTAVPPFFRRARRHQTGG